MNLMTSFDNVVFLKKIVCFKRILWDAVMHSQTVSAKYQNKLIGTMIPTFKTVLHMGLQDGICYQT